MRGGDVPPRGAGGWRAEACEAVGCRRGTAVPPPSSCGSLAFGLRWALRQSSIRCVESTRVALILGLLATPAIGLAGRATPSILVRIIGVQVAWARAPTTAARTAASTLLRARALGDRLSVAAVSSCEWGRGGRLRAGAYERRQGRAGSGE
eukprot:1590358-Prymnesium_polylepis.2